jgi:DNA-binding NtrC family response regulator
MRRKILFVDDETTLLFAAQQYLTGVGFEVECASELEEAQALLSSVSFDVVITDIRLTPLQGAEGLHVLDFIRDRGISTLVIVLTAHATTDIECEARRLGAEVIFYKPMPLPELAAAIERLCVIQS